MGGVRDVRDRRPGGRGRGHRAADAAAVRVRAAPPRRAARGVPGRPRPDRAGLPRRATARGAVQGLPGRGDGVPGGGRKAHRGPRGRLGAPPRLPRRAEGSSPDPLPGRHRVLPCRAQPRPQGRPRAVRGGRETVPTPDYGGGRVRPDVLPRQVRQHPVGDRPTAGRGADRTGPPRRRHRRPGLHREARPVLAGGHQRRPSN